MPPNAKLLALAAALTSGASSVLAALVPAPPPRNLALRADITPHLTPDPSATIHFLDCQPRSDSSALTARQTGASEPTWLSILVYCANSTTCLDPSHVPAPNDVCVKRTSTTPRDWNHWENEGDWQYCRFAERGWFSWVISRFGRLVPAGEEVGYAEDNDKYPFDGWRGDELPGAGPETHVCSRVYYFTVSQEEPEAGGVRETGAGGRE